MLLASLKAANSAWVLLLSPEQKIIFDKRQHLALRPNTNNTNTNYFLSIGRRRNQTSMTCFLPHPAGISFHGLAHISGPEQVCQMFVFSCLSSSENNGQYQKLHMLHMFAIHNSVTICPTVRHSPALTQLQQLLTSLLLICHRWSLQNKLRDEY